MGFQQVPFVQIFWNFHNIVVKYQKKKKKKKKKKLAKKNEKYFLI